MSDYVVSLIRTLTPMLVGWIASFLAAKGFSIPEDVQVWAVGALAALLGFLYYAVVRKLEQRHPKVGTLLGKAKQPVYEEPVAA